MAFFSGYFEWPKVKIRKFDVYTHITAQKQRKRCERKTTKVVALPCRCMVDACVCERNAAARLCITFRTLHICVRVCAMQCCIVH